MKVNIEGHEIVDASISMVSLVKRGANRAPFKIIKSENSTASGHLGPEPQPDYNRLPPETAPRKPVGGQYAEAGPNPMWREPYRYATDRHGAQAAQVAPNSLDAMIADAAARRRARGG